MDPNSALLGAIVGAFIAGLASLATARFAADRGFHDALELWQRDRDARDEALLVAVLEELEGNIELTRNAARSRLTKLNRSAWDAARGLPLDDDVRPHLRTAYLHLDRYNAGVERYQHAFMSRQDADTIQDDTIKWAQTEVVPALEGGRDALRRKVRRTS